MGVVIAVIVEHQTIEIEQFNCVACRQSQGGGQRNGCVYLNFRYCGPSQTNIDAVNLKKNVQTRAGFFFNSGEFEMINPRYWNSEDP